MVAGARRKQNDHPDVVILFMRVRVDKRTAEAV